MMIVIIIIIVPKKEEEEIIIIIVILMIVPFFYNENNNCTWYEKHWAFSNLLDGLPYNSIILSISRHGWFLFIYKKMVTFIKMKITILYYEYNITINVDIFYLFCWDCKVHIVRTFLVLFLVLHFVIRIFSSTLNIGVLAWIYWNLPKFGQTMQKYWW